MHAALRSPLTAGIALCGASAIALTPIAPTMPALTEIQARAVSSAEVALTAAANPIEQWAQVIQQALANGGVLAEQWLADPAPILRQLLTNGLGYGQEIATALEASVMGLVDYLRLDNEYGLAATLQRGITQIAEGQFYNGINSLFEAAMLLVISPALPLIGLLQIPVTMAQNFADVIATLPNSVIGLGFAVLGNVSGVVAAFGSVGQAVVDAISTGDLVGALNAIVGAPATLVGAFLNGFEPVGAPGILSPYGVIDQLMGAANAIAVALGAPVAAQADATLAKVSSVPDSVALSATTDTVETVTVSTTVTEDPVTEEVVAEEPVTEETVTEETATEEPSATTETETTDAGSGSTGEATTGSGGTDLSDGNKAEPGSAGESGTSDGGTGGDETDSGTTPSGSTDADGTGSADSSTGSDDSDSSGDSE